MKTAKLQIHKFTAPSSWASYFINGDCSGLEDAEIAQADAFIDRIAMGAPVGCEDVGFCHRHDAMAECPLAGDCQEYAFLQSEAEEHEIIVGNVGSVHCSNSEKEASDAFDFWVADSRTNCGRSGGEPVTWLRDGEIHKEHEGTL